MAHMIYVPIRQQILISKFMLNFWNFTFGLSLCNNRAV